MAGDWLFPQTPTMPSSKTGREELLNNGCGGECTIELVVGMGEKVAEMEKMEKMAVDVVVGKEV